MGWLEQVEEISAVDVTWHQVSFLALMYILNNLLSGHRDVKSQTVVGNTWILMS